MLRVAGARGVGWWTECTLKIKIACGGGLETVESASVSR